MIRTTTLLLQGDFTDAAEVAHQFRDVLHQLHVRIDAIHQFELLSGLPKMEAHFPGGEVDLRVIDSRHAVARAIGPQDFWTPHGRLQVACADRWIIRTEDIEQVPLLRAFDPNFSHADKKAA